VTTSVARIEEYSEYVEIKTANGDTHKIPMAVFRNVVSGKLTVNRIDSFIPIYREITRQWLESLERGR
jgi:hypothetical protein